MRTLYLYAKRLGPVLTIVLLILQIPDAGLTLWDDIPHVLALWA